MLGNVILLPGRRWRAAALLAAALTLAACGSSASSPSANAPASPTGLPASPQSGAKFYLSIGDSYAAGYQPGTTRTNGKTSTNGFAYQLTALEAQMGHRLQLVNVGCGGATTTSLRQQNGCKPASLGPGAANYPDKTQAETAIAFATAHRADLGLITVVIGGNDVTACARAKDIAGCLTQALAGVKKNLGSFLPQLRAAAGPDVPIVGLTYPDVILGRYVTGKPADKTLASVSVTAFKSLINPALQAQYKAIGATFVDVTTATGAYVPFSQTTTLPPYGTVPQSVAKACQLTYYCTLQDIHPRTPGYALIADLIAKALPAAP
jgi:lysophospholipase L1-like esterase